MIANGIELMTRDQAILAVYIQGIMLYLLSPTVAVLITIYTIRKIKNRKKIKDKQETKYKQKVDTSALNVSDEVLIERLSTADTQPVKTSRLGLEFNKDGSIKSSGNK